MGRVMADRRRFPSDMNCSLTIIGEEEEVIRAAAEHAASVHDHEDTPELRDQIREFLEPEEAYQLGTRPQEPMPG
jgi:predicted small metal-binding protein